MSQTHLRKWLCNRAEIRSFSQKSTAEQIIEKFTQLLTKPRNICRILTVAYKYGPHVNVESTGEIHESPIARPRKSHSTLPDATAFTNAQKTS